MQEKQISMKTSVLWNTVGNIFYQFCQWVLTILIVKTIGFTTEGGFFSFAITITNVTIQIAGFGMRIFQISDVNEKYKDETYIASRIITAFLSFIITVIFVLANGYDLYKGLVILIFMLFKISEVYFDIYSGIFQRKWRMDIIGKSLTIRAILVIISFGTTLYFTKDVLMATTMMTICSIISIFLYDHQHLKKMISFSIDTNFQRILELLKECVPLAIYTVVLSVISSYPRYILEATIGAKDFNYFASISTPTVLVQQLAMQVFTPFISKFSNDINQNKITDFYKLYHQCLSALGIMSIIAIIGAYFLGDFVLSIIYSSEILPYTYLLIPLIICTIFVALVWLQSSILTIIRANKTLLVINTIGMFVSIISSHLIIPKYGMIGTTISFGASLIITSLLLFITIRKKIK